MYLTELQNVSFSRLLTKVIESSFTMTDELISKISLIMIPSVTFLWTCAMRQWFSHASVMVDLRYVLILCKADNERSAVAVVTEIVK